LEATVTDILYADRVAAPSGSDAATSHDPRRWWILAVLGIAQLMVVLDTTVVSIALPSAQRALAFSNSDRQWIVTAYALAFGSLLLIGGRLADLLGRKRVFIVGLAGFAVASAVGGAATNFTMLVTARAVQGAFGALLAPAALALLTTTFTEPKDRAKAFGIFGAIGGAGAAVGLLVGGILTEYASWRSTMFVNLIFAVAALAGAALLLRHEASENRPKLDWPGTLSVSAGLFSLVYGFSHAETAGWGSAVTIAFLLAAGVLLTVFVAIQGRSRNPLLPLRIVLDRNRGASFLAMFAAAVGMFAMFLFLTYYLQTTQHYSAIMTGVSFLPLTGALVVSASTVSTVLSTRVSPRLLIPSGMGIAAIGMWVLTGLTLQSSYVSHILPATIILGLGLGMVFASAINVATSGVDQDDAGVASATVNTMQQVGGSVGTALLNTIAASAATAYVASHAVTPTLAAAAAVHSYTVTFWWASAIFAAAAAICAIVLRSEVLAVDPNAAPHVVG
jgi:EmrB/QacA subfamily drug resistance transporter